jgi:hypothetical protein
VAKLDVATFLSGFVKPLVQGGELHVSRPIALEDVDQWEQQLPHASVEQNDVDDARVAVLSTLVVRPPPFVLEQDELLLAAGLYNALFLAHPDADGVMVTERQRRRIVSTAQAMVAQPLTRARTRVLARHALLHNLFELSRTDTFVTWWTGRARYLGQKAPARLTRWRTVRRVREEVSKVEYDELLAAPDVAPVIASLLRRTPLTQLITTHAAAPALHWEDAVFLLRDPELARAVAYEVIRPGDPREQIAAPSRLAAAFEQMLERAPAEADVRAVAAFLVHIGALLALAEARLREPDAKSPLLTAVLAVERAGQRPRGLATFFALPNALAQVDSRLAAPAGLDREPDLARRWAAHRAQVADAVGEAVIEALAGRLGRHLSGTRMLAAGAIDAPPGA